MKITTQPSLPHTKWHISSFSLLTTSSNLRPSVQPRFAGDRRKMATHATTSESSPFCIAWKHVSTHPQHPERPRCGCRLSLRSPPVVKEAFVPSEASPIYAWSPGSLRPVQLSDQEEMQLYNMSSVFWRPDHQTYLTVPYDCTQISVRDRALIDELDNWERLKFGHDIYKGRCVSVIGHRYGNDVLAATGPGSWMPQLIPFLHQRHDSPATLGAQGTSLLAGDISIIMGLVALSATPSMVKETIERSFRPPMWVRHAHTGNSGEMTEI